METVATSQVIVQRAQTLASPWDSSTLHGIPPENINISLIFQAYEDGDQLAREIVNDSARALGKTIANLISILNIKSIIITAKFCYLAKGAI